MCACPGPAVFLVVINFLPCFAVFIVTCSRYTSSRDTCMITTISLSSSSSSLLVLLSPLNAGSRFPPWTFSRYLISSYSLPPLSRTRVVLPVVRPPTSISSHLSPLIASRRLFRPPHPASVGSGQFIHLVAVVLTYRTRLFGLSVSCLSRVPPPLRATSGPSVFSSSSSSAPPLCAQPMATKQRRENNLSLMRGSPVTGAASCRSGPRMVRVTC